MTGIFSCLLELHWNVHNVLVMDRNFELWAWSLFSKRLMSFIPPSLTILMSLVSSWLFLMNCSSSSSVGLDIDGSRMESKCFHGILTFLKGFDMHNVKITPTPLPTHWLQPRSQHRACWLCMLTEIPTSHWIFTISNAWNTAWYSLCSH